MHDFVFLLIPLCAVLWRLRGGLLNDLTGQANWMGCNDTVVRLIFAVGTAAAYGAVTHWTYHVALLAVALFGACVIGWFGVADDLTQPTLRDVALISASGLARTALVAAALFSAWPLVAGVLCGPLYWAGSRIPQPFKGCVWQELFFGAALGASIIA